MTGSWLDRTVRELRQPVPASSDFDSRVLAAVTRRRMASGPLWLATGAALAAVTLLAVALGGRPSVGVGVEFTIDLPTATSVELVGDFNDWDRGRTPLERVDGTTRWRARLPLAGGLYRYSYLVDGDHWVADPTQPGSADPDFGTAVSLVSVR